MKFHFELLSFQHVAVLPDSKHKLSDSGEFSKSVTSCIRCIIWGQPVLFYFKYPFFLIYSYLLYLTEIDIYTFSLNNLTYLEPNQLEKRTLQLMTFISFSFKHCVANTNVSL